MGLGLGLTLASSSCVVIPTAYGMLGVYSSTSAATKDKAGAEPPPEGTPDATPRTP
jgi:hypothetical protein